MFDLASDEDDEGPPLIEWQGIRAVPAPASKQAREALKAAKFRIAERQAKFVHAMRIRDQQDPEWFAIEAMLIADEIERILAARRAACRAE